MTRLLTLLLATVLLAGPVMGAELDGTLRKIKASNTITLGYREDARPFAYTGDDGKPTGYSVDLCTRIAASVARQLGLLNLQTKWVKVTPENRISSVVNGTVDLECGSTTASLSRQELVDFSLMVEPMKTAAPWAVMGGRSEAARSTSPMWAWILPSS